MTENLRSSDSKSLCNRLDFNGKYSRNDFHAWLNGYLANIDFTDVLDIGCGTGMQTKWFLSRLNKKGRVCALDISKESIRRLKADLGDEKRAEVIVGSMDDLKGLAGKSFSIKKFDLVHSAFSLYYASDPERTLRDALKLMKKNGVMAISGPNLVNTLLTFLAAHQEVPQYSWDCLEFMNDVVLHFCRKNFAEVETHVFVNNLFVTDAEDFAEYYRSSTFFDAKAEKDVLKDVGDTIDRTGHFHIQKNAKIVIASQAL